MGSSHVNLRPAKREVLDSAARASRRAGSVRSCERAISSRVRHGVRSDVDAGRFARGRRGVFETDPRGREPDPPVERKHPRAPPASEIDFLAARRNGPIRPMGLGERQDAQVRHRPLQWPVGTRREHGDATQELECRRAAQVPLHIRKRVAVLPQPVREDLRLAHRVAWDRGGAGRDAEFPRRGDRKVRDHDQQGEGPAAKRPIVPRSRTRRVPSAINTASAGKPNRK